MEAAQKSSNEQSQTPEHPPVVTLIGADIPPAYLDDAEPSPLMDVAARFWSRVLTYVRMALAAVLVLGYPAAIVLSHEINDHPVVLPKTSNWASIEAGTALTLLGRELTGPGWVSDRSGWHPQSRLTALPAWQDGIAGGLSDYTGLLASLTVDDSGLADEDLDAASRLLAPAAGVMAVPRLNAAAEALQRYDGRLARGLAEPASGVDVFDSKLALYADWAVDAADKLKKQASSADAWPASSEDITEIYEARARAHVAHQLILASLTAEPNLLSAEGATEAADQVFFSWRRAAEFKPLIVTSQANTGTIFADHPATLSFYMTEAAEATRNLRNVLKPPTDAALSVASAG